MNNKLLPPPIGNKGLGREGSAMASLNSSTLDHSTRQRLETFILKVFMPVRSTLKLVLIFTQKTKESLLLDHYLERSCCSSGILGFQGYGASAGLLGVQQSGVLLIHIVLDFDNLII